MSKQIPRPPGFMENPYIGKDGRDYHSFEAFQQANRKYDERMFREIGDRFGVTVELSPTETVRNRLQRWQDYYEGRSFSQPGHAYGVAEEVADRIFRLRKPQTSISTKNPRPELNLRISDELIRLLIKQRNEIAIR